MAESLPLLTEDLYLDENGRPTGTAIAKFDDRPLTVDEATQLIRDNVLNRQLVRSYGLAPTFADNPQFDVNDSFDMNVDAANYVAGLLAQGYANANQPLTAEMINGVYWTPALEWLQQSGLLKNNQHENLVKNAIRYQNNNVRDGLVVRMYDSGLWLHLNDEEMMQAATKFLQHHRENHPNELYPTRNLESAQNVIFPVPEYGGKSFLEQAANRTVDLSVRPELETNYFEGFPEEIRDQLKNAYDLGSFDPQFGRRIIQAGLAPFTADVATRVEDTGTGQQVLDVSEPVADQSVVDTTRPFYMAEVYEMFRLDPGYVGAFNSLNSAITNDPPLDEFGRPDPKFVEMQRTLAEDQLWQWPTAGLMEPNIPQRVIGEYNQRKVSTWDLLFMPREMNRQQRIDLHYNLMMGGYYQRVGQVPLFVGDANDEAFNDAYRLFIGDVLAESRQGRPTSPADRMKVAQEQNLQRLRDQVNQVTEDEVYGLAQRLSRSVLGRDPYDNEIQTLLRQIQEMDLAPLARGEVSLQGEVARTIIGEYEDQEPSAVKQQGQAMNDLLSTVNRVKLFGRRLQPEATTEEVVRDVMGDIND